MSEYLQAPGEEWIEKNWGPFAGSERKNAKWVMDARKRILAE